MIDRFCDAVPCIIKSSLTLLNPLCSVHAGFYLEFFSRYKLQGKKNKIIK